MNTPEAIKELLPPEVFVFGSNADGLHYGGAAKVAHEKFGAQWGIGEGHTGQSYAIPTMGKFEDMAAAVARFKRYASDHPQLRFLVTKIGTGIAGWQIEEVGPLFVDSPPNVILPIEFVEFA